MASSASPSSRWRWTLEPFGPGLFRDRDVGQQTVPVEADRCIQGIPAALREQRLEPRHVARDRARPQARLSSPLLIRASSPRTRRSRSRAWRRFCRAWASKCEPHSRVMSLSRLCGLRRRAGQEGEQAGQLLAGQIDGPVRPGQLEAAEQRKLKCGRWHSVQTRQPALTRSHCATFCNFHCLSRARFTLPPASRVDPQLCCPA